MGLTRLAPTVSLTPRERREARRKVKSRDLSSTLQPGLTRLTSTVSLPPRERREARRKAKALKDGLPPTATATKANKGGKLPLPTAASTRPRRSTEYAYIETEGGYEVRRVVRRKFTPEVDAGVPYLPGQDDIPRSDAESDGTNCTEPEDIPSAMLGALGYDEEGDGQDDDEATVGQRESYSTFGLPTSNMPTCEPTTTTGLNSLEPTPGENPTHLPGNTNNEDVQALFGSLNHFTGRTEFPVDIDFAYETIPSYNNHLHNPHAHHRLLSTENAITAGQDSAALAAPYNVESGPDFHMQLQVNRTTVIDTRQESARLYPTYQIAGAIPDYLPSNPTPPSAPLPTLSCSAPSSCPATPLALHIPTARVTVTPSRPAQRLSGVSPNQSGLPLPTLGGASTVDHLHRNALGLSLDPMGRSSPSPGPRVGTRALVQLARAHARSPGTSDPINSLPASPAYNINTLPNTPRRASNSSVPMSTPLRRVQSVPDVTYSASDSNRRHLDTQAAGPGRPVEPDMPNPMTPTEANLVDAANESITAVSTADLGDDPEGFLVPANQAAHLPTFYLPSPDTVLHVAEAQPYVPTIPTLQELRTAVQTYYNISRSLKRIRRIPANASPLKTGSRMGNFSKLERAFMNLMEHRALYDSIVIHPWSDDRETLLQTCKEYAERISGIDLGDLTQAFEDTFFGKLSNLRGNCLTKIDGVVEEKLDVTAAKKITLLTLMSNDKFLYLDPDQPHVTGLFRHTVVWAALKVILFQCSKNIGLAFMEELCALDSILDGAQWRAGLRDKTATKGMPIGAIAFAVTLIRWALEKMYRGVSGKGLQFKEQQFRPIWERYFRLLVGLPHLGELRMDLLRAAKEYYVLHWPGIAPAEGAPSAPPAWTS